MYEWSPEEALALRSRIGAALTAIARLDEE
jgi:hypothetical protein